MLGPSFRTTSIICSRTSEFDKQAFSSSDCLYTCSCLHCLPCQSHAALFSPLLSPPRFLSILPHSLYFNLQNWIPVIYSISLFVQPIPCLLCSSCVISTFFFLLSSIHLSHLYLWAVLTRLSLAVEGKTGAAAISLSFTPSWGVRVGWS